MSLFPKFQFEREGPAKPAKAAKAEGEYFSGLATLAGGGTYERDSEQPHLRAQTDIVIPLGRAPGGEEPPVNSQGTPWAKGGRPVGTDTRATPDESDKSDPWPPGFSRPAIKEGCGCVLCAPEAHGYANQLEAARAMSPEAFKDTAEEAE